MQALLLPARAAPPPPPLAMLRQRAVSASACASQVCRTLLSASGCFSCGVHGSARRHLTVAVAAAPSSPSPSPSSGPLYPTPPPTEQEVERVKLEQVPCYFLFFLWSIGSKPLAVLCGWSRVYVIVCVRNFVLWCSLATLVSTLVRFLRLLPSRNLVSCGLCRWFLV